MHSLTQNRYKWIPGIKIIDSWNPGLNIGISVCTHGSETVWLDVLDFLENTFHLQSRLLQWKIYFILTNIEAYIYSLSDCNKNTLDYFYKYRFIEENMNRCCSEKNIAEWKSSEARRIRELKPILWKEIDILLDIHSTSSPSTSMSIIGEKAKDSWMLSILNTKQEFIWVPKAQVWKPFIDIVERWNWIGIWLEAGCQFDTQWFKIGIDNVLRLLEKTNHIKIRNADTEFLEKPVEKTSYKIFASIIIESADFTFSKKYFHGQKIKLWEYICRNKGRKVYAEQDCVILLPKPHMDNYSKLIGEEGCFLGKIY